MEFSNDFWSEEICKNPGPDLYRALMVSRPHVRLALTPTLVNTPKNYPLLLSTNEEGFVQARARAK